MSLKVLRSVAHATGCGTTDLRSGVVALLGFEISTRLIVLGAALVLMRLALATTIIVSC